MLNKLYVINNELLQQERNDLDRCVILFNLKSIGRNKLGIRLRIFAYRLFASLCIEISIFAKP